MRDSLTLRVSAVRVGIDLKTAFRWRHRFLHASASSEHGIAHHRLVTLDNQRVIGKEYHIQNVNSYISRSKGWMARFHGVGTAYLPSYLAWRRLFESTQPSEEAWLRIAIGANQQPTPT